jgi:tRNA1(Val) A37 N6-methylase TrmN6
MRIIVKAQANLGSRQHDRKSVYTTLSTESGLREIKIKVNDLLQATKKFLKDEGAGSLVLPQEERKEISEMEKSSTPSRGRSKEPKKVEENSVQRRKKPSLVAKVC